jgi:hypothetical protein
MHYAIGISVHTGWAACVVVGGSLAEPEIVERREIELLGDAERFCFHMAADMPRGEARRWIQRAKQKALTNATRALEPLITNGVRRAAIVAKRGELGVLEEVLASHPRIHSAEGFFYRDVLCEACGVPANIVTPASLDISKVGKLVAPPWGKDQKLAALAAWAVLDAH